MQPNTAYLHKCNEYFGRVVFLRFLMNLKNKIFSEMGLSGLTRYTINLHITKKDLNI